MSKSMNRIVEDIKDIISNEVEGKVQDRAVAEVLGCTHGALATAKSRNVIMYQHIAEFCPKRSIAINFIILNQFSESLVKSTSVYELEQYGITY